MIRSEDLDVVPVGLNVEPLELAGAARRVDGDHPLGIQRGIELVEQRKERARREHARIEAYAAGTCIQFGEQLLALELTSLTPVLRRNRVHVEEGIRLDSCALQGIRCAGHVGIQLVAGPNLGIVALDAIGDHQHAAQLVRVRIRPVGCQIAQAAIGIAIVVFRTGRFFRCRLAQRFAGQVAVGGKRLDDMGVALQQVAHGNLDVGRQVAEELLDLGELVVDADLLHRVQQHHQLKAMRSLQQRLHVGNGGILASDLHLLDVRLGDRRHLGEGLA